MAMDAKPEDARTPKEEVSQDQESFEDMKVNEALKKIGNEIKTDGKAPEDVEVIKTETETETETEQRESSYNDNESPTERKEKESLEYVKVRDEEEVTKEMDNVDNEKDEKICESSSKNDINGGEDFSKSCALLDLDEHEKNALEEVRSKLVDDEKDEKQCESSSTNDINGGEDFSKNCELLDLDEHEKNALAEVRSKLVDDEKDEKQCEGSTTNDINGGEDFSKNCADLDEHEKNALAEVMSNLVDDKKDEKQCESSSTNDINEGEDFSKNCALLDLDEHEKNALSELKSKHVDDEKDEKQCESSSTNDINEGEDFSKNCVLHDLDEHEKNALAENRSKLVDDEKDEKQCESSFTNDINGGEGFSKNCALLHLNEHEKNALAEFRSKLEEAISTNKLFEGLKKEVKKEHDDQSQTNDEKQTDKEEEAKMEIPGKSNVEDEKNQGIEYEDITLWGVPLLPSKGDERTDVILEKFLKAREFKANNAFEMFRNTLWWRKQNKIDSILEEDFGGDYDSVAYISGFDLDGHPVCYNVYGVFGDAELYNKTFGTEESRQRFLRWRLQMMEKQIQKLNFKPGGVSSLLQINDLENTPGPARKDIRIAMKQAVGTLQENYPEFVHRNIFINVPFWYYAFNALLSPFLAPRTKSKFVFIRPARVTETLLKYVSAAEIPIRYGGLKRENDSDFSIEDGSSDVIVKGGSIEVIEVPAPEKGCNLIWDVTVIGWEVNYKEEFVPDNESSYTIIIKKERRMGWQKDSVRNSFVNNEPGKVVLTIENASFKKKRVLYRYKTIKGCTSSS